MYSIKKAAIPLILTLCIGLLSGCLGGIAEIDIKANGSGTISVFEGMSKSGLDMYESMSGEEMDLTNMMVIEYDGVTYYGEETRQDFSSIEELNSFLNGTSGSLDGIDTSGIMINQNSDRSFELSIRVTPEDTGTDTIEYEMQQSMPDADKEEIEKLLEEMAVVFKITFPCKLNNPDFGVDGVVIDNNIITIDFLNMVESNKDIDYTFTTTIPEIEKPIYDDTDVYAWYYEAIKAMTEKGLLAGVGNNKFAPNADITYAQFCQILARACGVDTESTNSTFWAYEAIRYCLDQGYILDRGEINNDNYGVGMSREAAVYGIVKYKTNLIYTEENYADKLGSYIKELITAEDIPDFSSISPEYAEAVLDGYKLGITSGVSSDKTFSPKTILTRAQVCQLLYNSTMR